MEKFFRVFNRYVISILLFVFGLMFLVKYMAGDALESQPISMLFGSLALILVAVLSTPAVLDGLSGKVYKGLLVIGTLLAAGLAYSVFYSVDEEIKFQETQKRVMAVTVQRLKDIRAAQEAHQNLHGTFADTFDSLIRFVEAPVIPVEFNMGSFHDTLSESESVEQGYVLKRGDLALIAEENGMEEQELFDMISEDKSPYKVRDTIYTSFYAENFDPKVRMSQRLPQVSLDSLAFNPFTGERFVMKTSSTKVGGRTMPTILVQDPTPFGREKVKKDTLRFGSLREAHLDGNWRN